MKNNQPVVTEGSPVRTDLLDIMEIPKVWEGGLIFLIISFVFTIVVSQNI